MRIIFKGAAVNLALAHAMPLLAAPQTTSEAAITQYCEPLIAGSSAKEVTQIAKDNGFKEDRVGNQPVLIIGELILAVSDSPRVCLVQAPSDMTFAQGTAVVDAWAARHPGAVKSPTTQGPDGSPVRAWAAPKQSLLVAQQTNARGQKVLSFILMPLPKS